MAELTRERTRSPRRHPSASQLRILGVGWVLVAAALQLLRSTGAPAWDTIWAEDSVFLTDALKDPLGSLFVHLSGYLQVTARVVAAVAAALPMPWAAGVLSVVSTAIVSLLSAYVFVASREILGALVPRFLLAALMALLPVAVIESTANAANLQYFLLFACFWAIVHEPRGRLEAAAGAAVVVATGLNTVFAWLYLPLAIWRWRGATSRARAVVTCYLVAIGVQAIAVFIAVVLELGPSPGQPIQWAGSDFADLPGIYALRIVGSLLLGTWKLSSVWSALGWWLVVALLLAAGAVVVAGLRGTGSPRGRVALLAGYSVATLVVPVVLRGTEHLVSEATDVQVAGARYTLTPSWFLYSAMAAALWREGSMPGNPLRIARSIFAGLICFSILTSFSQETYRSDGPRWSTELATARARCEAGASDPIWIPTTPYELWSVGTTCGEVTGGSSAGDALDAASRHAAR